MTFVMYVSAITFARHSLHVTTAYFVPDDQTLRALTDAASQQGTLKVNDSSASHSGTLTLSAAEHHDICWCSTQDLDQLQPPMSQAVKWYCRAALREVAG